MRSFTPRPFPVLLLVTSLSATARAASGDLDPSFASGGKYLAAFSGTSMFGPGIAVRSDGRIVVAGKHFNGADDDFATLRLTGAGVLEGSMVTAFSSGRNEDAKAVLVLADGRIVVGGEGNAGTYAQHGIIRYLANGTLDSSFGSGGKVSVDFGRLSHIHAMAVQPDGKLLVAGDSYGGGGTARMAMARLNTDGTLDSSFGVAGRVQASYGDASNGHAIALGPDGRITVGGYVEGSTNGLASACFIARFSSSGQVDTSYGSGGSTIMTLGSGNVNYCFSLVEQTDGRMVLAGQSIRNNVGDFVMARFTTAGQLDTSFGTAGVVSTEFGGRAPSSNDGANTMVQQPDGKLLLGGYTEGKFAVARYLSSGALDTGFGAGGKVSFAFGSGLDDQIKSLALQPDGKIVAAGFTKSGSTFHLAVVRLLNDSGGALADADRLFNWAEATYPQYFSPRGATTQLIEGYTGRLYSENAIGVKDGRVYVYGAVFGGLLDVGTLATYLPTAVQAGY